MFVKYLELTGNGLEIAKLFLDCTEDYDNQTPQSTVRAIHSQLQTQHNHVSHIMIMNWISYPSYFPPTMIDILIRRKKGLSSIQHLGVITKQQAKLPLLLNSA